jgi:hypothetical protein
LKKIPKKKMMPERENNSFWEIAEIIDREMSILRKMRPVGPKEKALLKKMVEDKEKEHENRTNSQP